MNIKINEIKHAIKDIEKSIIPVVGGFSLTIALLVLQKQIPRKPNAFDGHFCGSCNGKLARQTDLVQQKYCHHCGQKLDWEEKE
jgi:hypothetical protein